MKTVLLTGTFDTKRKEYQYLREKLEEEGVRPLLKDVSCKRVPSEFSSDIPCKEVAQAAKADFFSVSQLERVPAQKVMTEGTIKLSADLFRQVMVLAGIGSILLPGFEGKS